MLGGGSLAAGGFGMAGGTAVITGGGAILGGGGAIPMMAVMLTTSEGIWDEQYAKILVYGRYILRDCIGDEEGYRILRSRISAIHQQVENQLKDMKEEKNSLDRETISLTESFLKYLRRLDREMQKKEWKLCHPAAQQVLVQHGPVQQRAASGDAELCLRIL